MMALKIKEFYTRHKDLTVSVVYFFLSLLYFFNGFVHNEMIWGYDTPKIILPLMNLLDESFKHLQLPLWTPDIYFGFPIGADGQIPWSYPFSILHIFLPFSFTLSILALIHVFAAGIFTYFFARIIGLCRFASFFAGFVYMFNGFIVAHMQYFSHIYAYGYLPLILFLIELAIFRKDNLYFILAGWAFGLQLSTGHPNIPIMTLIFICLYLLIKFKMKIYRIIFGLFLTISTALIIALPYVSYTSQLIPLSIRGQGVDYADATNSSFSIFDLITFIFPNFYFRDLQPWTASPTWHFWTYWGQIETTGYVGIMTLLLIPLALIKKIRQKSILFLILLVISLMLALGKNAVVYKLLFNLPVLNGLRAPGKFLFLVDFCLALLSGWGITSLFQDRQLRKKTISIILISINCVITIAVIAVYFITKLFPEKVYNFISQNYSSLGYVENLDNSFLVQETILNSLRLQTENGLIIVFLSTLLILLIINGKIKNSLAKIILFLIIAIDLFIFSARVNVWKDINEQINNKDPFINQLKNQLVNDKGRVYTFGNFWSNLLPDQLMSYHIPEANGFVSLPLKRFEKWQKLAESRWINNDAALFKLGSIKYVYSLKNNRPVLDVLDNHLPRAYLTTKWTYVANEQQAFDLISRKDFDLNSVVLETNDDISTSSNINPMIKKAVIDFYQADYIKVSYTAIDNEVLVLTDTNYPGWKAYLNSRQVPILQTNYLFKGVRVPKGSNVVEFKYKPDFLNYSLLFSLCTVILIALLSANRLFKKSKNRDSCN